ncbi:MAG: HNH endonuclease [Deferrisomatales bacterium]|nr:HNH endonuclease [Deferrisomatales bacterium]
MYGLDQQVLRVDVGGVPLDWIDYQEAVRLHHLERVAYSLGTLLYRLRGGTNARSGRRTVIEVRSVLATVGGRRAHRRAARAHAPPLSNPTLFGRDAHLCLYCGQRFPACDLSRDHVTPLSRGGQDTWSNVVTACKRCNHGKSGRTPEEAGMELLAVPFTPSHAEYVYLQGRRILSDQMDFLVSHFPRRSPLHARLSAHPQ